MDPVEPWSSSEGDPFGPYIIDKFGYKQALPIDRTLPYDYVLRRQVPGGQAIEWGNLRGSAGLDRRDIPSNQLRIAKNDALDKVREQTQQASDLVVAWLQRKDAIGQLEGGLRTILRTVRAVKRRDPRIVRAVTGRYPDRKSLVQTPSGLWLGYWFGIVPTINDIHHAAGVLALPFPESVVSGSSGFDWEIGDKTPKYFENSYGYSSYKQGTTIVKIGARVSAINSNVSLLDRLGFTSPLSVALELVPWSWALNYFVNIQQMATNFEPRFPGIELGMMYQTQFTEYMGRWSFHAYGEYVVNNEISGIDLFRTPNWPEYELSSTLFDNLSLQRISYLTSAIAMGLKGLGK